jgi:short-subunit dehydrogenase
MKRAIIVGATSGIGFSIAKQLADKGCTVGITGRREHLLEELKKHKPKSIFFKTFDVKQSNTVNETLNSLTEQLGGLDLLVISSGIGYENPEYDFFLDQDTIETNVVGFTSVLVWAWKFFEKQGHGHIAGITSIAGLRGAQNVSSYNASKSYQIKYLEGLKQKAAKTNNKIIITDIRPGFVDTEMAKGEGLFWVATVEKAATEIIKAINKKKNVAYITKRWQIIAVLLKIIPGFIYRKFL